MGIINHIEFGGVNCTDFDIYASGEGVFNAPERDVEMISIPGRNGSYALDRGRFDNIDVTYRLLFKEGSLGNFSDKLSAFRNALASQKGYQRLTDTFHPNEYRMAVFKDGIELTPAGADYAAEFEVTFNCRPQRYLVSGETKQTVSSGSDLVNPTLFESHPLLEVYEYGEIHINDDTINLLSSREIGEVLLANKTNYRVITFDSSILNTGDSLIVGRGDYFGIRGVYKIETTGTLAIADVEYVSGDDTLGDVAWTDYGARFRQEFTTDELTLVKGTPFTLSKLQRWKITTSRGTSTTPTIRTTVNYDGDGTITVATENSVFATGFSYYNSNRIPEEQTIGEVIGVSTKPTGGNPTYIDLDIGEVYKIEDGKIVSLNKFAEIPAELPVLKPGTNEITFDNTITQLDITPRWWKI
jgi:phage-related protein